MRQLIVVLLCLLFTLRADPAVKPIETLIGIEQSWLADTDGHAGKSDEMANGRKCWRVEQFDFHDWQTWRCTILEGPLAGTIQWEWRIP